MDCSAGDDDGGGACSGEAKPPLSHTHSLPTPKHKPSQRSSSEEGRSATTGETSENDEKTSTSSQSSNVRGSRAGSERHHSKLGHPKHSVSSGISRSQSVRTKGSSNKVWNLGNMAKAVGCGMTAFGSNVVSGSKAVGTEMYHGTVVVGANVMEGTKAAGRVTKDVTLAAGKGVVHAGERMADSTVQAGKIVASASVNAVQDTVDKTTLLIEEGIDMVDPTLDTDGEGHLVLPGENLESLSSLYSTTPEAIILRNRLTSRHLRPGTKVSIPQPEEKSHHIGHHPMESLHLKDITLLETGKENEVVAAAACVSQFATLTLTRQAVYVGSASYPVSSIRSLDIEHIQDQMPELLPPERIKDHHHGDQEDASESSEVDKIGVGIASPEGGAQSLPAGRSSKKNRSSEEETCTNTLLRLVLNTFAEGDAEEEPTTAGLINEVKVIFPTAYGEAVLNHIRLWFPDPVNADLADKYEHESSLLLDELGEDDGTGTRLYASNSCIITRAHLLSKLQQALPQPTRSQRWNRVYLSILDGYSLQNFYRKLSNYQEPFLLIIQDTEDEVFGAYVTNIPCLTDEFIGTGESFLFKVVTEKASGDGGIGAAGASVSSSDRGGGNKADVKVSVWNRGSTGNQHFFQGKSNCMVFGASGGQFGIWVDGNLDRGRIDPCSTFEQWPPTNHQPKDFKVKCLECYNFV